MPTYTPIDPIYLSPGVTGGSTTWRTITANQRAIYEDHGPPLVSSAVYALTTSSSDVVVAEWPLWKNLDHQPIKTWILWSVSTGSATGTATVEVTDGSGSNSAAVTTSATSPGWASISVTPSSSAASGSPRTVRLKLKTSTGTATIYAISSHYAPAAVTGIQASGYAPTPEELYAANAPVSSERYARAHDGPIWTVKDRPRCLFSVLDDFTAATSRALMQTSSADGTLVYKGALANAVGSQGAKVSVYLDADGSATAAAWVDAGLGGAAYLTGSGWRHASIGLAIGPVKVTLANTGGSGNAFIRAVIITRGLQS